MKRHRLLVYDQIRRRTRSKLVWLALILLAIGLYDQFTALLGDAWFWIWIVLLVVALLWFYYSFLVRRASIQVRREYLRLQGPLRGVNISYRRIHSATSGLLAQHHPRENLKGSEQSLLEPFYNRTCLFIELKSYPRAFRWRHLWFSRFLFGTSRPGLLCVVEDWMALSRDVEAARAIYQEKAKRQRQNSGTLAAQVLALDDSY